MIAVGMLSRLIAQAGFGAYRRRANFTATHFLKFYDQKNHTWESA
jgi:hypothetical protein